MAKSGVVAVKVVWLTIVAVSVLSSKGGEAAVTCNQVVSNLSPCLSYVINGGATVPGTCCNGIRTLFALADTTPDRQTVCTCIKTAANAFNLTKSSLDRAAALPKTCGVNIPYKISPSTDCTKIQ